MKLVLCFYFCFLFSQGRVDGVAAIVGKNIILHSDVLQQAQYIALSKQVDPIKTPYLFEEIYLSSLTSMVNQYILLSEAEQDTNIII